MHREESAEVAWASVSDAPWTSLGRCSRHVPPGGGLGEDPGHAGETMSLGWPGNASGVPRKSWRKCLGAPVGGGCDICIPCLQKKKKQKKKKKEDGQGENEHQAVAVVAGTWRGLSGLVAIVPTVLEAKSPAWQRVRTSCFLGSASSSVSISIPSYLFLVVVVVEGGWIVLETAPFLDAIITQAAQGLSREMLPYIKFLPPAKLF
ncbi:hypothetical protein L3Q82_001418 [Scortum barcoo]|uniref:Uncharacterized protein n=1 Tax=Scortum barcoo TaxID=214431 RepID=A0ACB8W7N6_9TELE|nr:hypothetical protein L3Q82_001418 [Scortum barcoo]